MSKLIGDVSPEKIAQAEKMEALEYKVDKDPLTKERKAQIYTCLAHDWYELDMEEEGDRLLLKSEKVCPGYFKDVVVKQQLENKEFDLLVNNITHELLRLLIDSLKESK